MTCARAWQLVLAMLPAAQASLFISDVPDDVRRLDAELAADPEHTLILWPAHDALTIEDFLGRLPADSPWRERGSAAGGGALSAEAPLLRIVVIDAVYNRARRMFNRLRQLHADRPIPNVALHPTTLSVYHRAQANYRDAAAAAVARSESEPGGEPSVALRICTIEAIALLLQELGEPAATVRAMTDALLANNDAVQPKAKSEKKDKAARRAARRPNQHLTVVNPIHPAKQDSHHT